MYIFTDQIHSYRRADRGYVICSEKCDHLRKCLYNIGFRDDYFRMLRADIPCDLCGILEIYCIRTHTDGKGLYRLIRKPCRNRANER